MALDALETDLVGVARNVFDDAAPRRVGDQGLNFELTVKVLQRDDPPRRS